MADECLVYAGWNTSCTDGFGVLSGRGDKLIGELDGSGGIECITPSPASTVRRTLATPIGIGAWAIGGGKWDSKEMNESAN